MRATLRNTAILALPSLINAVALFNLKPRATGLPDSCNSLYTAQIPGCGPQDFRTLQCSSTCISALEALVAPIQKACGGQGISGQNLIVAFLAGVGPQQVCHNAGTATTVTTFTSSTSSTSTTSTPKTTQTKAPTTAPTKSPTTSATPKIISSTSTASKAAGTRSLLVDSASSSSMTSTTTQKHTAIVHTTQHSTARTTSKSISNATGSTSTTSRTTASKTTSAGGNSQTDLNDGSGGGSPFDTAGNLMNSGAEFSIPILAAVLPAIAAAAYLR